MPPIISIVGKSESGKTTLLESLIARLKERDYKVVVIKHSAEDFELDEVGKDTWRFSQASSEASAISSAICWSVQMYGVGRVRRASRTRRGGPPFVGQPHSAKPRIASRVTAYWAT